jgi:hypothetical protein
MGIQDFMNEGSWIKSRETKVISLHELCLKMASPESKTIPLLHGATARHKVAMTNNARGVPRTLPIMAIRSPTGAIDW